ncbi:MAG: ABC transporter permease [Microlunatus sp.]|nr:ABC transporter permease [Microlunatus sp.]
MRFLSDLWRILRNDKGSLVGGVIVGIYCLLAIFGPIFVKVSNDQNAANAYQPPSWVHPLGTDALGMGVMSQIIVGARPIMIVGVLAAILTIFVGVLLGLLSGYAGGITDSVIMRITDVFLTVPGLPLIIVLAAVIHTTNPFVLAAILSITAWAGLARAIRSQALSLRTSDFVEAARLQGVSMGNMVGRQLLPNVGPYVAIHFLLAITGAIYAEVGLFLLGIAPIAGTNWGIMINLAMSQGALYTTDSAFYLFSPMAAIVILQVAFVFFSRALDSVFNPRLRVQ